MQMNGTADGRCLTNTEQACGDVIALKGFAVCLDLIIFAADMHGFMGQDMQAEKFASDALPGLSR